MENIQSSKILLRGAIYGSIIGSMVTGGLYSFASLSLSAAPLSASDGVFGQYFQNIINTACPTSDGDEVLTGFKTTNDASFGTKVCQSLQSMLDAKNIYSRSGNVGIGTNGPSYKLDVSGDIRSSGNIEAKRLYDGNDGSYYVDPSGTSYMSGISATGDICTTQGGKTVCLDSQKGDPIYQRGVENYTGKYPTNDVSTGNLGKGLKQEWDEYGRAGCQKYKDLYGTWTAAEVANCQAAYPGDGRTLVNIVENSTSMALQINTLWYQEMGGNPWVPRKCSIMTRAYICSGYTQCGKYPSGYSTTAPDFLFFYCFGK